MTDLTIYAMLFGAGTAMAGAAVAKVCIEQLLNVHDPLRTLLRRSSKRKKRVQASPLKLLEDYRGVAIGGIAGCLLMFFMGLNTAHLPALCLLGLAVGAGLGWFAQRGAKETARLKKLRQIAALYEAINFYTRAGYTVQQSLALAVVLAPGLRRPVEKCLAAWPSGPVRALNKLADEIRLPEAAMLTSVLTHAQESGMSFGRAAIEEESRNLEALRQTLAELRIVSKPVYFAVYRAFPLAAIGGVVVGPLVYRLLKFLEGFFGF